MLLQTVSHCLNAGWVVIYIPKASKWMNSSFAYNKVPNTTTFVQPLLASTLAAQISSANKDVLSKILTSEKVIVGSHHIEKGTPLTTLLETGVKYQIAAQDVMEAFMKELNAQKEYVLDEFSHVSLKNCFFFCSTFV